MKSRSIFHISDLHFGRHSEPVVESLLHFLSSPPAVPDLVVVSGDLTQRARQAEFRAARAFLERLPGRVVCVPGNHDISLYRPLRRLFWPYERYDKWIGSFFPSSYEDNDFCLLGIRTNRRFSVAEGKLREEHVEACERGFGRAQAQGKLKLLVCHHPLLESLAEPKARRILAAGPDLVLSGHRHQHAVSRLRIEARSVLALTAGTAISTRTREEVNGFNWIEYDPSARSGEVRSLALGADGFTVQAREVFSLP